MPVTPRATRLDDDQLRDLLRLAKGSDSVELKLSVPASGHRSALRALGVDALDAQIRQVFFFDTPDLQLYNHGLNLRARRIQNKGEDSVVNLPAGNPQRIMKLPSGSRREITIRPREWSTSATCTESTSRW